MTKLIPDPEVAKRYGITLRTIYRWEKKPSLGFPQAVWINGRKYRYASDLDAFDRATTNRQLVEDMKAAAPAEHEHLGEVG